MVAQWVINLRHVFIAISIIYYVQILSSWVFEGYCSFTLMFYWSYDKWRSCTVENSTMLELPVKPDEDALNELIS